MLEVRPRLRPLRAATGELRRELVDEGVKLGDRASVGGSTIPRLAHTASREAAMECWRLSMSVICCDILRIRAL